MTKILVEFHIKGAVANMDAEPDKKKELLALELARQGKEKEAIKALGPLKFEWIWANGDGDPSELFEESDDIKATLTSTNSKVAISDFRGCVSLSASVTFELKTKKGVSSERVQKWMDDNSMFICGYVGGGWGYHQDDGCELTVLAAE